MKRAASALALLLTACAGSAPTPRHGSEGEELYDSQRDWERARPVYAPSAPVPQAPAPTELLEPAPSMRAFTGSELLRIRRVQRHVRAASLAHRVPPDIVNGVIWVESKFVSRALGQKGPRGLMQLMPRTGREVAEQIHRKYAPFDPEWNIHAGTYYLARMVDRFHGNLALALAAYNIGPAHVDQWVRFGEPLPPVSRRYVDLVFTAARAFREREP